MGFFSRWKAAKKEAGVTSASKLDKEFENPTVPTLRFNVSECSLPEFKTGTTTITRTPTAVARPILKRATKSDNSIFLTMHAANNRLGRGSPPNSYSGASFNGVSAPQSRSASSTRPPKQVSFKLDGDGDGDAIRPKLREPFEYPKQLPPSPNSDESDLDDWHDSRSDSSTGSLASSRTSVDFELTPIERSGTPQRPTRVAAGFERRMSKLPPIADREVRPRPKVALGHSRNGQPSWTLKSHRQSLAVV